MSETREYKGMYRQGLEAGYLKVYRVWYEGKGIGYIELLRYPLPPLALVLEH